jgi:hypothetical protein
LLFALIIPCPILSYIIHGTAYCTCLLEIRS